MGLTGVVLCQPLTNACNDKAAVGMTKDVHYCGKRPQHEGTHCCVCYWTWSDHKEKP